jgi:hypothetical protein
MFQCPNVLETEPTTGGKTSEGPVPVNKSLELPRLAVTTNDK